MAAALITLPFRPVLNLQGGISPGATLGVYQTGTLTPVAIYANAGLTTPLSNPLTANAAGVFPAVYFNDATTVRLILKTADDTILDDVDPYIASTGEAEAIVDQAEAFAAAASASATAASGSASAAAGSATAALGSANAAAASAASAINAPGTSATSTTSNTIGTGSRTFTIETGKAFAIGQFVIAARTSAPGNYMIGQITAHNPSTGALTINSTTTAGSGTFTDWTIALTTPGGSGTVTSVELSGGTTGLTATGGPITTFGTITLGGTLALANGGTGATTAGAARTNLGATTVGANIFTLVNPSAIRFLRINADNTVTARNGAEMRADISAAASGANTDITALNQSTTIMASGTIASNSLGFRGLPQVTQTSGYTLVLADQGRHISITTGGITIPANGTTAFPIGSTVVIYNDSASPQTIAITTDTLRLAGTATTGSRTLAQRGICTLVKVAATEWVATGNVT